MSESEQSKSAIVSPTPPIDPAATVRMVTEAAESAEAIDTSQPNASDDLAVAIRDSINVVRQLLVGPERIAFGRVLGLLAIGCMLFSGYNFWWKTGQLFTIPYAGLNWALAGAVLLFFSLRLLHPVLAIVEVAPKTVRAVSVRIRWPFLFVALVLLFISGDIGRQALLQLALPIDLQVVLFVGSGLLFCWSLGAFRQSFKQLFKALLAFRTKKIAVYSKTINRTRIMTVIRTRRIALLVMLITLVGLGLRLWQLENDVRIMVDEEAIYHSINVLSEQPTTSLFAPWQYGPANFSFVYTYFARWTVLLSGNYDLAGARLLSVILGTLTIPALFLLATALFDDTTGLIAAVLLAVYPVQIHFSRLVTGMADPLFGVLMLAFMVRAFKRNTQSDFVLAGACAALSGYFYEGGRYVYLGLFIGLIGLLVISGRGWSRRRGLIVMVMAVLAISFPYFYTLTKPGYSVAPRTQDQMVRPKYILQDLQAKPVIEVLQQHWDDALSKTFYHTIYTIDGSRFYYGGNTAMLLWYMVPFYLLGLFITLWRFRYIRWLLWVWIGGALLGVSLLISTDWTIRYSIIFAALILAVAIGIRYGLDLVWLPYFDRKEKRLKPILYALLVIVLSVAQVNYYFNVHLPTYYEQVRQIPDFYDVFEQAHAYSPSNLVYITNKSIFPPVLDTMLEYQKLDWHYAVWSPDTVTQAQLLSLPRTKALVFAVWPDDLATVKLLKDYLGVQGPFTSPFPNVPLDKQYLVYVYEPGVSAATPGYF